MGHQKCCWFSDQLTKRIVVSTHWSRVMHIYVTELTIIGSDNGLLPGWRQAIIWTNAGILLIGHWGTNFSEILSKIHTFSSTIMHLKMLSAKCRPFCLQSQCGKSNSGLADDENHCWENVKGLYEPHTDPIHQLHIDVYAGFYNFVGFETFYSKPSRRCWFEMPSCSL